MSITSEINWNSQQTDNFIGLKNCDKMMNDKSSSSQIDRSPHSASSQPVAVDYKQKAGYTFNTTINSSNLSKKNSNQFDKMSNQSDSIDYITLHSDIISIAEFDSTNKTQSNQSTFLKGVEQSISYDSQCLINSVNLSNLSSHQNLSSNHLTSVPYTSSNQMSSSFVNTNTSHTSNHFDKQSTFRVGPIDAQQFTCNVDDGLTNLSWLQNLNMCNMTKLGAPTPPASPLCNLTPFSIISPQSSSIGQNQAAVMYSKPQSMNTKAIKTENRINGRKQRTNNNLNKMNGSKTSIKNTGKQFAIRKQNKLTNGQTYNRIANRTTEMMNTTFACMKSECNVIDTKSVEKSECTNSSLDLLYNGGHPMLNSVNYTPSLCNSSMLDSNNSIDCIDGLCRDDDSKDYLDGEANLNEQIDFQTNEKIKPPFSYGTLIIMAMQSNRNKMTLRSIYKWIKENFIYYSKADPSWQNSIRHNLSLNKCFIKIARTKEEPGKGGFWKLDPKYAENLVNGVFKRRKQSQSKNDQLDSLQNKVSEKGKSKKRAGKLRKCSNLRNSQSDYNNQDISVCQTNDNLMMMHDTPPNSAESYSGYIENQTDIEITNAVNSIDLINGTNLAQTYNVNNNLNNTASISGQTNEKSKLSNLKILNDCNLTQCNNASNDSNAHLPIHLMHATSSSLPSHQIITTNQPSNHYMIQVTNTNNQEQQITIQPMMTNGETHQLHSNDTNCAFTPNDLTQLTALNTGGSEMCLENGSNINLTAENCLLSGDNEICWNTLLTDELRLVDPIGTYATTSSVMPTLSAIPINQTIDQVVNPTIIQTSTISQSTMCGTTSVSSQLLNDAQVSNSNQISNRNLIQVTSTTYCSASNVDRTFANQIDTMSDQMHNSQTITSTQNIVSSLPASTQQHNTTWNSNRNYMTYNQVNNQLNNNQVNGQTTVTTDLTNLTARTTSLNDNHDTTNLMQINSNGLNSDMNTNCNHFDNSNPWIDCTMLQANGKPFESNTFDLENFSDLDNCSTY